MFVRLRSLGGFRIKPGPSALEDYGMTKTEGGYVTQQYLKDLFTIFIYVYEFLGTCVQIDAYVH